MALGKTLQEIELMPEQHFQEYLAFYQEQPFGLWREDYRSAQIAHILAMINKDPKGEDPKLTDFMPLFNQNRDMEDDGTEQYLENRKVN